jgi:hypothetical protein
MSNPEFTIPIREKDYIDATTKKKKRWKEMDSRCNQKPRFLDPHGKRERDVNSSVLRPAKK